MASDQNNNNHNLLGAWVLTLVALFTVWPVGLILLIRMLSNGSLRSTKKVIERKFMEHASPIDVTAHEVKTPPVHRPAAQPAAAPKQAPPQAARPTPPPQAAAAKTPKISTLTGTLLLLLGALSLIVAGISSLAALAHILDFGWRECLRELAFCSGGLATGFVLLRFGISRRKKVRRYRKYLTLIGKHESLPIDTLAKAMPISFKKACADLQDMLDASYLPAGYLDYTSGRLILSDAGLADKRPAATPQPPQPESGEDAIVAAIRAINDDIDDEAMSHKVARIQEITGKILDYQRKNPEAGGELRSFLDYYLPTTLKLLRTYAQLEEQGVEGRNISATKAQIEGMMDKMVDGYEARLDKLFQSSALDISSDIAVLEQMLQKDGLAQEELTLER